MQQMTMTKAISSMVHVRNCLASFSTSRELSNKHYRLVVAGAGSGGSAIANKFEKKLGRGNVAVIEPSKTHYYQPMWTLIGAGIKSFDECHKPTESILAPSIQRYDSKAQQFDPDSNQVTLEDGSKLSYDYLVIAIGMKPRYDLIKGAEDALENDPMVVSNYSPKYVQKTYGAFQAIKKGKAIFTFPQGVIKCSGAPQKIMYLFDDFQRNRGTRDDISVDFYSALGVIFPVVKYQTELNKICEKRKLHRHFKQNLVEIKKDERKAVFENVETKELTESSFDFIHVAPSFTPWDAAAKSPGVSQDGSGWVSVNKETLQHVKYPNIFSLGDCSNIPTSKTAAAIAGQIGTLSANLSAVMAGKTADQAKYDGYTSCPLITSYKTCIMAEFDYDLKPKESFFLNQGKERRSMFYMKAQIMPQLYWRAFVRGNWHGPGPLRWLTNPMKS